MRFCFPNMVTRFRDRNTALQICRKIHFPCTVMCSCNQNSAIKARDEVTYRIRKLAIKACDEVMYRERSSVIREEEVSHVSDSVTYWQGSFMFFVGQGVQNQMSFTRWGIWCPGSPCQVRRRSRRCLWFSKSRRCLWSWYLREIRTVYPCLCTVTHAIFVFALWRMQSLSLRCDTCNLCLRMPACLSFYAVSHMLFVSAWYLLVA